MLFHSKKCFWKCHLRIAGILSRERWVERNPCCLVVQEQHDEISRSDIYIRAIHWYHQYCQFSILRQCKHNAWKWKPFARYWPFVREIRRSPVNSPHKGQRRKALIFSLVCAWTNDWADYRRWFEMPSRSLWRYCNGFWKHLRPLDVCLKKKFETTRTTLFAATNEMHAGIAQYIPRNMHTILLCFALLWSCNRSSWIHMKYLSIFIRVALLALGQSLDCHSASEVGLMDMGKPVNV